jgi:uncharacterized protein YebE (UPF0316 family)
MHINWSLLLTCLVIALARVTDISLDTVRTVAIVQGRRAFASVLGFVEALVYIVAVGKVLQQSGNLAYAVAYAAGFAAGTYLGIALEQRLALGEQVVAIFTRRDDRAAADALRALGYRVTEFQGRGREGDVDALYIQIQRRRMKQLIDDARRIDPACFYLVHDVRLSRKGGPPAAPEPEHGPRVAA